MERAAADVLDSPIESLDQSVDPAAASAWHAEIERRLEQMNRGSVDLVDWSEALRTLRSRLLG